MRCNMNVEEKRSNSTKQAHFIHMLDEWFLWCARWSVVFYQMYCVHLYTFVNSLNALHVYGSAISWMHHNTNCFLRSIPMKMRIFWVTQSCIHHTKESDFAAKKSSLIAIFGYNMLFDMRIKVKTKWRQFWVQAIQEWYAHILWISNEYFCMTFLLTFWLCFRQMHTVAAAALFTIIRHIIT